MQFDPSRSNATIRHWRASSFWSSLVPWRFLLQGLSLLSGRAQPSISYWRLGICSGLRKSGCRARPRKQVCYWAPRTSSRWPTGERLLDGAPNASRSLRNGRYNSPCRRDRRPSLAIVADDLFGRGSAETSDQNRFPIMIPPAVRFASCGTVERSRSFRCRPHSGWRRCSNEEIRSVSGSQDGAI